MVHEGTSALLLRPVSVSYGMVEHLILVGGGSIDLK